jgi:hypothetical protein
MIIAVDFDGVLVTDEFPDIGKEDHEMSSVIRNLTKTPGVKVILWTSRTAGPLLAAIEWCLERGIQFDAINDNAPSNKAKYEKEFPNGTRKVYADVYVDDHNLEYNRGKAINLLKRYIRKG